MKPYRVIISTPSLNIEVWTDLYRFIDSIYTNDTDENKVDALHCLKERCIQVWCADEPDTDVYILDGQELTDEVLMRLPKYTCYSILYQNSERTEEYTGLAPFVFFLRRFILKDDEGNIASLVSLGIGTDGIKNQGMVNSFYFKCSNFFLLYDIPEPVLGEKTIYFFSPTAKIKTKVLAGKGKDSDYQGDPNRRFLPLLEITEENYHSIFTIPGIESSETSKEYSFIYDSLCTIKDNLINDLLKAQEAKLDLIVNHKESLFGQWLVNAYFCSFEKKELKRMTIDDINRTIQSLQIYKRSIFELIQNIIFHGGVSGLFYCVFDKKKNLSPYYKNKLPDFRNPDSKVRRFLRIGIYDYSESGIADTYNNREQFNRENNQAVNRGRDDKTLLDFFKMDSISTIDITHLDMRHAARLGIKSFVKTVFEHNGYFSVESNELTNGHSKKRLTSSWINGSPDFNPPEAVNFVSGTHYEIILPVEPNKNLPAAAPPIQRTTLLSSSIRKTLQTLLKKNVTIKAIDLDCERIARISNSTNKDEQIEGITSISNSIIGHASKGKEEVVVLNLSGNDVDHKLIFKMLAYMQLTAKGFKRIILINGTDTFVKDFCDLINSTLLLDNKDDNFQVWSDNDAIILISQKLHVQIISGRTKSELYSLNQEFQKFYCNNFFPELIKTDFNFSSHKNKIPINKCLREFILPYDILVESTNGVSPFEFYSLDLLKQKIIPSDLGFMVNHDNTYIGNKIIVKNYYEADMMFQNSFFAERFAYLIAQNIKKVSNKQELILIGYKHYSEYILKAIKELLNDKTVHIVIADEDNDTSNLGLTFDFDVDGNKGLQKKVITTPNHYQFATIVPIGATLSTNDKIIALFKLWIKQQTQTKRELPSIDFVYNHCVIIVRDVVKSEPTDIEIEQKWKKVDTSERCITTDYINAKEIHFSLQIANEKDPTNNVDASDHNWWKRLNNSISFPQKWQDEKYVNYTENSSINSQNLMGFPRVDLHNEKQHDEELDRLYLFKNFLYKGHFVVRDIHQKFFIDTESFVRRECRNKEGAFIKWLITIKEKLIQNDKFNILITPNAESESDFINAVNEHVFDGNALIIYLDVKNWRNNIVHKLAFIKNLDSKEVSFHFVDHLLFTGETYLRTKSYLHSIEDSISSGTFHSIITIVNRLPYTKNQEIKVDVDGQFFPFVNLYYPISKLDGRECELCKLIDYYDDLSRKTVLDTCKLVIKKNVDKLEKLSRKHIDVFRSKQNGHKTKRNFMRLIMTHELFYRISQITGEEPGLYTLKRQSIHDELDAIYDQLCNKKSHSPHKTKSRINELIEKWFEPTIQNDNKDLCKFYSDKLKIDKMISFLKVISSPPLSQYIIIREYAHNKLLLVLDEIINTNSNNNYCFDDLRLVKSILKSLSFLKSNALVRKDVIVGAWTVLWNVINNLEDEKKEIKRMRKRVHEEILEFKKDIKELDRQSENSIYNVMERNRLNKDRWTANQHVRFLNYELSRISKTKEIIIKEYSKDLQFYIKNAIVADDAKATFLGELIRKGTEMSSFKKISISRTNLATPENNKRNKLFNSFQNNIFIQDETFYREFKSFLVWLFYDNTTIIQKTLFNFFKELEKDQIFRSIFFEGNKLKDIERIKSVFRPTKRKVFNYNIEEYLNNKIKTEYYFSSFKPYLDNGDKIKLVQKLVFTTYAKLKLEDIIYKKNKTSIESDIPEILNMFSEIMDADAAFLTIRKGKKLYPISLYGLIDNALQSSWNYDDWNIDSFYTHEIFAYDNSVKSPLITQFNIQKTHQAFGETKYLKMHSLCIFTIENPYYDLDTPQSTEKHKNRIDSTITFLYNDNNPLITKKEQIYRVHIQESGRLLLLLKNEIKDYIIEYLIKDRVIDLWIEMHRSARKFEKIYTKSAHVFKSVYKEMDEFESLNEECIRTFHRTWFFLANETISHIYSNIENNALKGDYSKHFLSLDEKIIIDDDNTLDDTFNSSFIKMLSALLDHRWNEDFKDTDGEKNTIIINDMNLLDFKLDDTLKTVKIPCKKHLIRTIIVQCLHNSLGSDDEHGHRGSEEIKTVRIIITPSTITIEDYLDNGYYTEEVKIQRKKNFDKKKEYIKHLICDEYSCTTLTSLQGLVNYMNSNDFDFDCDYSFNDNNNFRVTIKFN